MSYAGKEIGPWITATVQTGSWVANTSYSTQYRMEGVDMMRVKTTITLTGAPTSIDLLLNPPDGKVFNNSGAGLSQHTISGISSQVWPMTALLFDQAVWIYAIITSSSYASALNRVSATIPITWANGDKIIAEYVVRIVP